MTWTLTDYQETGVAWLMRHRRCLLADGVGIGKTVQAVTAWQRLRKSDASLGLVVVCPKKVTSSWRSHVEGLPGDALITYYKALPDLTKPEVRRVLPPRFVLVLDEAHVMRTTQSALWRKVRTWVDNASFAWVTDGTPAFNVPANLTPLCRLLGAVFRAGDDLVQVLKSQDLMLRRTRVEIEAALPPLRQTILRLELPEGLAKDWSHAANWAGVRAAAGLAKVRHLLEDERFLIRFGLRDRRTVLWCFHVKVARLAHEVLRARGVTCHLVTGATSKAEKEIEAWRRGGGVLVATQCLGAGVQLQDASLTIFFELPYETRAIEQALARMHRTGQAASTECVYTLWRHAVDERIRLKLLSKDTTLRGDGL